MTTPPSQRGTGLWIRSLRAITGLYLLAYVTLHLINLSLGLISLDLMEAARPYLSGVWTGDILGPVLMMALLTHYLLGLWGVYRRPSLTGTTQDMVQALSGLVVIPLLATHAIGVSMLKTAQVAVDYELVNRIFWLSNPGIGLTQVMLITVVWVHGCAGFFIWLKAWPRAVPVLPWLYPLAVAIPVVALLGYTQAGRLVLIEGVGPVIEQMPNADGSEPASVPYTVIKTVTNWVIWISAGLSVLVLAARGLRVWRASAAAVAINTIGVGRITGCTGQTLLDNFRAQNQPHANLCSGRGRCGTCAVRILQTDMDLPHRTPAEQATLDRLGHGPDMRLACQLLLQERGNLEVARALPPDYAYDTPGGPRQPEPVEAAV